MSRHKFQKYLYTLTKSQRVVSSEDPESPLPPEYDNDGEALPVLIDDKRETAQYLVPNVKDPHDKNAEDFLRIDFNNPFAEADKYLANMRKPPTEEEIKALLEAQKAEAKKKAEKYNELFSDIDNNEETYD